MHRPLLRFASVSFALIASLPCAPAAHASVWRADPEPSTAPASRDWRGGPVSLPIGGMHSPSEILAAAKSLPQAIELVSLFIARGYVRRGDLDVAGRGDSVSYALLAWQKPGVPVRQEAPVIRIVSMNYRDAGLGRRVIATQAFGAVVRDSTGVLVVRASGADVPAAAVQGITIGSSASPAGADGKTYTWVEGVPIPNAWLDMAPWVTCTFANAIANVRYTGGGGYASWVGGAFYVPASAESQWIGAGMTCE